MVTARRSARPDLFFCTQEFYNRRGRNSSLEYLTPGAYEPFYHHGRQSSPDSRPAALEEGQTTCNGSSGDSLY